MQDPQIILADEPIASLDPMNAQIVMESLRRIHEEDGRMVIANLHTLDTARRYCDRVIGMRDGRIVFDGTPGAADHRRGARHLRRERGLLGGRDLHRDRNAGQTTHTGKPLRPPSSEPRPPRPRAGLSSMERLMKKTIALP
jgi:ABC-type multidrug transport system ATPase subunit